MTKETAAQALKHAEEVTAAGTALREFFDPIITDWLDYHSTIGIDYEAGADAFHYLGYNEKAYYFKTEDHSYGADNDEYIEVPVIFILDPETYIKSAELIHNAQDTLDIAHAAAKLEFEESKG